MLRFGRIVRALNWLLFSELHTKKTKERLSIPDEVITDRNHLFEDIQLGMLILKLPLCTLLALLSLFARSYQGLFAGIGIYLAFDFLFQYVELSRGEETWHQRRHGALAIEILGAFRLSPKAVSYKTGDPEAPDKLART